ncbi:hypothetical protein JCM10212_000207 [Sporobolomyces blumeae]
MLPSLSSLWNALPHFSTSPAAAFDSSSVPISLQQRLVSFALRRALAGVVDPRGLDPGRVTADWRGGQFELRDVELDKAALDPLLASSLSPTVSLSHGSISRLSTSLSYSPSTQLSIKVETVEVVLNVKDRTEAEDWIKESTETLGPANGIGSSSTVYSDPTPARDRTTGRGGQTDLERSTLSVSVAQDFVRHELSPSEESQLLESIHVAPARRPPAPSTASTSDFTLPGAFGGSSASKRDSTASLAAGGRSGGGGGGRGARGDVSEEEPGRVETTLLAGLIERLLSRLNVTVEDVTVRLRWHDDEDGREAEEDERDDDSDERRKNEVTLVIDLIEYVGDAQSMPEDGGNRNASIPDVVQGDSVRMIKVAPPRVYLDLVEPRQPSFESSIHSSSTTTTKTTRDDRTSTDSDPDSDASHGTETNLDELAQSISLPESIASLPPPRRQVSSAGSDFDLRSTSPPSSISASTSFATTPLVGIDDDDVGATAAASSELKTTTTRPGRSEGESSEDESEDEHDMMIMSQSIADLRTSVHGPSIPNSTRSVQLGGIEERAGSEAEEEEGDDEEGGEGGDELGESASSDLFQSAASFSVDESSIVGRSGRGDEETVRLDPFVDPDDEDKARSTEPHGSEPEAAATNASSESRAPRRPDERDLIVSLGDRSTRLTFYLVTRKPRPASTTDPSSASARSSASSTTTTELRGFLDQAWIVAIGTEQAEQLMRLSKRMFRSSSSDPFSRGDDDDEGGEEDSGDESDRAAARPSATGKGGSGPSLDVAVSLSSIVVLLAYPLSPSSLSTRFPRHRSAGPTLDSRLNPFASIWASPDPLGSLATLRTPHLRFKLDKIVVENGRGMHGRQKGTGRGALGVRVRVGDLGLWEAVEKASAAGSSGGGRNKNGQPSTTAPSWTTLPIVSSNLDGDRLGAQVGVDWKRPASNSPAHRVKTTSTSVEPRARVKSSNGTEERRRTRDDAVQLAFPGGATSAQEDNVVDVTLGPMHVLCDLSVVSRVVPVLERIMGGAGPDEGEGRNELGHERRGERGQLGGDRSATPRGGPRATSPPSSSPPVVAISGPLVRLSIRCPAPRDLRKDQRDPDLVRSGIVVVDFEGIAVKMGAEHVEARVQGVRAGINGKLTDLKLSNFLSITSLSPSEPTSVQPSVLLVPSVAPLHPLRLDTNLPLVHLKLDKPTLDSLQLFADDLTQYFSSEFLDPLFSDTDGSTDGGSWAEYDASRGNEAMRGRRVTRRERDKLIGSRYFGTKSFLRTGVEASGIGRRPAKGPREEADESGRVKTRVGLNMTDFVVDLLVPTSPSSPPSSPRQTASAIGLRRLRLLASDVSLSLDTLEEAVDDLRLQMEVADLLVEEIVSRESEEIRKRVVERTGQRDLTAPSVEPLFKLAFSSSADPQTDLKESKVQLGVDGATLSLDTSMVEVANELAQFLHAPEGAFEEVVPNELTRLRVRLVNLSLHLTPPSLPSRVVVTLSESTVKSDLMPDLPRTNWVNEVRSARVWMIEGKGDLKESDGRPDARGGRYWKSRGFVQLADLETASIVAKQGNGLVLPDFELGVSDAKAQIALCADSISALTAFADDMSRAPAFKPKKTGEPDSRSGPAKKRSAADLLASVDFNAFEQAPSVHDLPEVMSDDVPANLDYLAEALATQGSTNGSSRGPRRSDASLRGGPGRISEDVDGETVRMLTPQGIKIVDDWLAEPKYDETNYSGPASKIRLRLLNSDVCIHLHEGYDWFTTRNPIEEEAKAVRRRLEKIRQLLATGQTPDATAENASVLMFGSHQLGLPPGSNELNSKELLAAINEELDQAGQDDDAVSTTSSWQTFPAGQGPASTAGTRRSPAAAVVGKARKKLTRSKTYAIEINARGLNAHFDGYSTSSSRSSPTSSSSLPRGAAPASPQLASKITVDVASFDIIDNIKTSTWRKFLTELRPSDGGIVRASGAPMARVDLTTVKPVAKVNSAQEEINLKVKISPLRLYIDQDALDFLKAFGSFQAPATGATRPTEPTSPSSEAFYQRVEVLPVKLKLDYKPKRVDYYALKQGKTGELMNFFHFDGSEMTLRHLIVTGVSGTTTLSNLVQDIWTPDVKSNQFADVISGIAPMRSVVNVGSGMANLVLLPIEQYRKDGRVVRGLQKGAQAFAKQTTLEAINVGAKLATGTQVILEQAEHVLGARSPQASHQADLSQPSAPQPELYPAPTVSASLDDLPVLDLEDLSDEEVLSKVRSRYADQPLDLRQGVESAYKSLGDNFKEAAQTILAVPMEVYERSGTEGPVRAVVRAVPIAVLKPMIGASGAVSKALLGLRNTLDPDQQRGELEDKYKRESGQGR